MPLDMTKQSWLASTIVAAEAVLGCVEIFVGAVLALPFLLVVASGVSIVSMSASARRALHFHHVNAWLFYKIGLCTVLSGLLLWAGLALAYGWRSRYQAQGAVALVILTLVGAAFAIGVLPLSGNSQMTTPRP